MTWEKGAGLIDGVFVAVWNNGMPRQQRADEAGGLYHAIIQGNSSQAIFWNNED